MTGVEHDQGLRDALRLLVERCPRLTNTCYWAGTSAISLEELHHRQSFDLDFHTRRALENTSPLLAELQAAFPGDFQLVQAPDSLGSGFQGLLKMPHGSTIMIEVLSNFDTPPAEDLTDAVSAPGMKRVTILRYLADKIQCVAERNEARDLVDIFATLQHAPGLLTAARNFLAGQEASLITERLLAWTPKALADDLSAYPDVRPEDAQTCRDLLLKWLAEDSQPEGNPP